MEIAGNSLAFQWLGLHAFTAEGMDPIPGQGTKILQTSWYSLFIFKELVENICMLMELHQYRGRD